MHQGQVLEEQVLQLQDEGGQELDLEVGGHLWYGWKERSCENKEKWYLTAMEGKNENFSLEELVVGCSHGTTGSVNSSGS